MRHYSRGCWSARSLLYYDGTWGCSNPTVHFFRAISLHIESSKGCYNFKELVSRHYVTRFMFLDFMNLFKWYYMERFLFQFRSKVICCVFIQLKMSSLPVFHHCSLFYTISSFDNCTVWRWFRSEVRKMALWPLQIISVNSFTTFIYFFFLEWSKIKSFLACFA